MNAATKSSLDRRSSWPIASLLALFGAILTAAVVRICYEMESVTCVGYLLLAFGLLISWQVTRDVRQGHFDILELRYVFLAFFSLYVVSLPLFTYLRNEPPSAFVSTQAIGKALGISTVSLAFFILGYHLRIGTSVARAFSNIGETSVSRQQLAVSIIVVATATWFALFVRSIGGFDSFLGTGYTDLYEVEEGKELFGFSVILFPTCVLLLYHLAHRKKSRVAWIVFIAAFICGVALLLVGSRRRLVVTTLLSLLIYRHFAVRRIPAKVLMGLALIAGIGVSGIGLLRVIPPKELLQRDTVQFLADQSPSQLLYGLLEAGEPANDFETFPFLITEIENGTRFQWGKSFLQAPLIMIPKAIFPSRPPTASVWYTSTFFPEVAAKLGGYPLFFLAEAYLNFGALGAIVLMLALGLGCQVLHSFVQRNHFSSDVILIYATVIGWIPSAIRIDFATTLKVSVMSSLPVILLVIWHSRDRHRLCPTGSRALN